MNWERTDMNNLRKEMPLLAKHEGVWDGWYRLYDANGNKLDEHRSRLVCRIPEDGTNEYHQTNYYSWANGKTEIRDFPATYRDGRIWFDNELIVGWAAEVPLDQLQRTLMLYWKRKTEGDTYLYEMIQRSDCGRYRHRVWHWYNEGRILQRTLIDEEKVSERWQGLTGPTFAGEPVPQ
jgi:hypothetical protein